MADGVLLAIGRSLKSWTTTSIYAFSTDQEWKHVEDLPVQFRRPDENMKLVTLSDQNLLVVDMSTGDVLKLTVAVEGRKASCNKCALSIVFPGLAKMFGSIAGLLKTQEWYVCIVLQSLGTYMYRYH